MPARMAAYGGVGVMGPGGNVSWDVPDRRGELQMSDLVPSGVTFDYGVQGIAILPFNAGVRTDYTESYSIGDAFVDYVFPAVDYVTGGWLSGAE